MEGNEETEGQPTAGSALVARWFIENNLPTPYTTRDLEDLARRIDALVSSLSKGLGLS